MAKYKDVVEDAVVPTDEAIAIKSFCKTRTKAKGHKSCKKCIYESNLREGTCMFGNCPIDWEIDEDA